MYAGNVYPLPAQMKEAVTMMVKFAMTFTVESFHGTMCFTGYFENTLWKYLRVIWMFF